MVNIPNLIEYLMTKDVAYLSDNDNITPLQHALNKKDFMADSKVPGQLDKKMVSLVFSQAND